MVHTIRNYDLEERSSAVWEGYTVEFTWEEFKQWENVEGVKVLKVSVPSNNVTMKLEPKKSEWEELFV